MKIHERPVAAKPSCAGEHAVAAAAEQQKRTADEQNETQRLDVGEYISRLVIDDGDEQREKLKNAVMSKIKPTVRLILLTFIVQPLLYTKMFVELQNRLLTRGDDDDGIAEADSTIRRPE